MNDILDKKVAAGMYEAILLLIQHGANPGSVGVNEVKNAIEIVHEPMQTWLNEDFVTRGKLNRLKDDVIYAIDNQ